MEGVACFELQGLGKIKDNAFPIRGERDGIGIGGFNKAVDLLGVAEWPIESNSNSLDRRDNCLIQVKGIS